MIADFILNVGGVVSWSFVLGNLYQSGHLGAKILAVVRSRESAVTRGLEYYYQYRKTIQFGRCRESGRFSEARRFHCTSNRMLAGVLIRLPPKGQLQAHLLCLLKPIGLLDGMRIVAIIQFATQNELRPYKAAKTTATRIANAMNIPHLLPIHIRRFTITVSRQPHPLYLRSSRQMSVAQSPPIFLGSIFFSGDIRKCYQLNFLCGVWDGRGAPW